MVRIVSWLKTNFPVDLHFQYSRRQQNGKEIILSHISDWIQVVQAICMAKVEIKNLTVLLYFRWRGGSTLLRELGRPHLHSQNMCAGKQIFDHHISSILSNWSEKLHVSSNWSGELQYSISKWSGNYLVLIWRTISNYYEALSLIGFLFCKLISDWYEEMPQIDLENDFLLIQRTFSNWSV